MKAVGIDLGTTNSVVAFYNPDEKLPGVLTNGDGTNLTPSVVGSRRRKGQEQDEITVGETALGRAARAPADTIVSVKRLMGRNFAEPQIAQTRERFNYEIAPGPDDDPRVHVVMGGKPYTPAQISSKILSKLRVDATRALGGDVTHAVITVPAYFEGAQRAATREAGEAAGLTVKKIIDEPTAAAIAFGFSAREGARHRILVFDLGGGTFDISILQMVRDNEGHNQFAVMDMAGDNWLGGDDFDLKIVERIIQTVIDEHGADPSGDQRFLYLAKQEAEKAKRQLSQADSAEINIPAAFRLDQGTQVDVELLVTRTELESLIEPSVARTMTLVQQALERQQLTPDDISDVLLVGGATLTPLVYQRVENFFGAVKVRRTVNPMECVALGASILAGTLRGLECAHCGAENDEAATDCAQCGDNLTSARAVGETKVHEPTALPLGIAAVSGAERDVFATIIPKGTPYPLREPMRRTFEATSRHLRVPVYEGEDPVASRNRSQGVVEFDLPEEVDPNARVEVSFNYDKDRVITVAISVPETKIFTTKVLQTDIAQTSSSNDGHQPQDDEESWREELEGTEQFMDSFLQRYGPYIEPAQTARIKRDLERAGHALIYADEMECRRLNGILQAHVYNSGLATQLYLADYVADGAAPERARQISEAAQMVRRAFDQGDQQETADRSRILRVVVEQEFEQRFGTEAVHDKEDLQGMLKILGG